MVIFRCKGTHISPRAQYPSWAILHTLFMVGISVEMAKKFLLGTALLQIQNKKILGAKGFGRGMCTFAAEMF